MTQRTSPFIESKYGWDFGESGWNIGMDENLLKFSYLFDNNIDGVVSSLPNPVNGTAYLLTSDMRVYFVVNSTYYSTPLPKWFKLKLRTSGENYIFDGSSVVKGLSTKQVWDQLQSLNTSVATKAPLVNPDFSGIVKGVTKAMVGLSNVDNTSDLAKPVSDATKTQLDLKVNSSDLSDPSKGAYLVSGASRFVNSVAEMLSGTRSNKTPIFTLGYYAAGDGGGNGPYLWDASSTAVSNGVTVFGTGTGRYILQKTKSQYNVLQAGAKGDGVTDDSAAFQACISAFNYAYVPYKDPGYVVGNLTLASNQKLIGESKVKLKLTANASYGVRLTSFGYGAYAIIENILWDGINAPVAAAAMLAATGTQVVFGFRIKNVDGMNLGAFYAEEPHATNYTVDVTIQDCVCYYTRGLQVYSRRSRGFWNLFDVKIDHTVNTGQVTWGGVRFDDFVGIELTKVDVVGPVPLGSPTIVYQPTAVGITLSGAANSASVWLRRVLIDNTRGPGMLISNCHNVFGIDTCIFQNLGQALELNNVHKSSFTNTKLVGGIGLTGAPNSANGLSMSSCTYVEFNDLKVESTTGTGVVQVSCSDCAIIGGYSNANTQSGYVEVTAATRNIRQGVRALSNGGNSLVQIGAQSATVNWYSNTGTYIPSTVGSSTV